VAFVTGPHRRLAESRANATGYAIAPQYARSEVQHWIGSPEPSAALCTAPIHLGPAGRLTASTASAQATAAKGAFLALWNPIAAQLNLAQYNQGQI
jgi:hypothetical protein